MTKVTPAIQAELERRRLAREPSDRIAADHGLSGALVRLRTGHLGVAAPLGVPRAFDYGEAVALSADMPVRVVAAQLKAKPHAVWRALRVMRRGYP